MMDRIGERRKAAGEGGFTLIELLVVIIILGILAAVVVFAVGGVGDKGQSSACKIDTRTLRTAEEAFFANGATGQYTDEATLVSGGFLSEQSTYHDIVGLESNGTTVDTTAPFVKFKIVTANVACNTPAGTAGVQDVPPGL